jgi:membrane protein YqaA with SNARE-associated domain
MNRATIIVAIVALAVGSAVGFYLGRWTLEACDGGCRGYSKSTSFELVGEWEWTGTFSLTR